MGRLELIIRVTSQPEVLFHSFAAFGVRNDTLDAQTKARDAFRSPAIAATIAGRFGD
jgi:hypothetical protein